MPSTAQDRQKLAEIHEEMNKLPAACVAAICKHAMGILGFTRPEVVTLGELDAITDEDSEL